METAGIHRAEILSVHNSKSLSEGGAMAGDLRLLVTQRSYCALAAGFEKVMTYPIHVLGLSRWLPHVQGSVQSQRSLPCCFFLLYSH